MRSPDQVIASQVIAGGMLRRVIGSTDFKGQGTRHTLAELGPFVMFDDAPAVPGPGLPPFGSHPHAGLAAVSFIPAGNAWRATSSIAGHEDHIVESGQSVLLFAGSGLVHDEHTHTDGHHELFQIIFRVPASHRPATPFLTLIPTVELQAGVVRAFSSIDIAATGVQASLVMAHVTSKTVIPTQAGDDVAFVYVRRGDVTVNGAPLREGDVAAFQTHVEHIHLESMDAVCLVGAGASIDEPWAKLLGHNGFVVAATPDEAQTAMDRVVTQFGLAP